MSDEPKDTVTCRVCYEEYGQITESHLSMHGMSVSEYKSEYPDAPIHSEKSLRDSGWDISTHPDVPSKISEAIKEKHKNGDYNANAK